MIAFGRVQKALNMEGLKESTEQSEDLFESEHRELILTFPLIQNRLKVFESLIFYQKNPFQTKQSSELITHSK